MTKNDDNSVVTQIQYRMVEKLTEMNRKLADEIETRKQSEKELKISEKKYRQIIEETSEVICVLDKKGFFTYVNQIALNLTGLTEKEILGKHFTALIRSDYKKKALEFYTDAIANKIISTYWEFPLDTGSDEEIWIGQNVTLLTDNNKITSFQAVARDVTNRIKHQQELVNAKIKAEDAAKAKSQFLANMSHEIRTPMNGIIGLTNLLLNTELSNKQEEYLNAVATSSETLMVVINDILDISKIEAGKLRLEQSKFKIRDVIASIIEVLDSRAAEKSLSLIANIDQSMPEVLIGDVSRLNQIMYNILGNAIKFTKHGEVKLRVRLKEERKKKVTVEFVISDTGVGISKSKLTDIFSAFTQEKSDTARIFGGTGLGLTIVKKLVELQQGSIEVESTPGIGSVFTITIDYNIGKIIHTEKLTDDYGNRFNLDGLKNLNILLAEDNPVNQMVTKDLLNEKGAHVTIANNGKEAISILAVEKFDLVLMDMQMPVMDGYEAMAYIRSEGNSENRGIPILALTAHAIEGEMEKCINAGASDYLSKPFNPKNLFQKVIVLTGRTYASIKDKLKQLKNPTVEKVTDLTALKEFTNDKATLMISTLDMLIEDLPKDVELMVTALNDKDWDNLRSVAHRIKPNFLLVAKGDVRDQILQIEQFAAKKVNLDQLPEIVKKVRDHIPALIKGLKVELAMLKES